MFSLYCQGASGLENDDLLRFYAEKWEEFERSSRLLQRVFIYLNTHWVHRQREEGNKDVYPAYELALRTWCQHMQKNGKFNNAIQSLRDREQNGEAIDSELKSKIDNILKH